jgi:hypothetical protein
MKTYEASAKFTAFFALMILLLAALTGLGQANQPFSLDKSPLPAPTGYVND